MKTEVVMQRKLFGQAIAQKSKSEFLSATDLVRAGNIWRVANGKPIFDLKAWLKGSATKAFIAELEKEFGKVKISSCGRGHHTWVHPLLFIDIALAISPKLKIEVYKWLYDLLLRYRNVSGDSFRLMSGALWDLCPNKRLFKDYIVKVSTNIKLVCNVSDWQTATEEQLILRNKIHNNVALLAGVLRDSDQAVKLGIHKALE